MIKTIKLPIVISDDDKMIVLMYQRNQNNVIRFTYNRLLENDNLTSAQISTFQKQMNNIFVDSHLKGSATYKAKQLITQGNEQVIFGGKHLFIQRCQGKISREEFKLQKLLPIIRVGQANANGNSKFSIIDTTKILFKPTRNVHVELKLPFLKKKLKVEFERLKVLQDAKLISITYELDCNYVYITYDDAIVNESKGYVGKQYRFMGIDLNPNYIGYSIIDWNDKKLISSGLFNLTYFSTKSKDLKKVKYEMKALGKSGEERNKIIVKKLKHLNGKRDHETIEIAKKLFNIFKGFNCSVLGIENLSIKSKDNNKGKNYNRLVNNEWLRHCLIDQLTKRIDRIKAKMINVIPDYSSFVGNLLYRDTTLPDPVLSSIEINRRAFEFNAQYIEKSKPKEKVILFPNFESIKHLLVKPLEGFGLKIDDFTDWKRLYGCIKNSKVKYRVPIESIQNSMGFSKTCRKSKVLNYNFAQYESCIPIRSGNHDGNSNHGTIN